MAETLTKNQRLEYEDRAWDLSIKKIPAPRIAEILALPVEEGGLGIELTRESVWKALTRVNKRKEKELSSKVGRHKARQHSTLDKVQEEAWSAYERSQQVAVQEKAKGIASRPTGKPQKAEPVVDEDDPEKVEGGCYLDERGEEIPAEERAKRMMLKAVEKAREEIGGSGDAEAILQLVEQTITKKWQVGDPRFLDVVMRAMADQRKIYGWDAPTRQVNENLDVTGMSDEELDAYIDGSRRRRARA